MLGASSVTCPHCSGYGTILTHDRETDQETERNCMSCFGTGLKCTTTSLAPDPKPAGSLEKELDEITARVAEKFKR